MFEQNWDIVDFWPGLVCKKGRGTPSKRSYKSLVANSKLIRRLVQRKGAIG
ncbi:hypothetical protein AJ85_04095 [Alkalihalobacillus alcalophilus ATCC 27647 = CGMCC 1.3604]|uniref:Uncharacterized protein n=1 Tax=Alkalihalobacillus alcalophilus ATCC 27647 = CGMCC 1.3604 TaxID=1218173 RepID=A0A4S4K1W4_ALKAL|nr:hypothetical protein AJ85_04095 [Alkalihalobacillus alcalophilus ATCC 27647 = CGMCC 1.3604]